MSARSLRRWIRGVLAVVAFGAAAYLYGERGWGAETSILAILGALFAYQAASGQG